jgi:heme-degrading monooxygenase HmoA
MQPYYAVIFSSTMKSDISGYAEMAERMEQLAKKQSGYLGFESAREAKLGITISYWQDENSIAAWKNEVEHTLARSMGREKWYQHYHVRVCRVAREYQFESKSNLDNG